MTTIYPIPAGRNNGALMLRRMMSQLQTTEKRLLRVEQQLTSGMRIQVSSEDPTSANRAVTLQRLLEVKGQLHRNIRSSQLQMNATDTALAGVANIVTDVRGMALRGTNSTIGDTERETLAFEVQTALMQMMDVGNQSFRGRYLFAGSEATAAPFENYGDYVLYNGNDTTLRTFVAMGELFDTNVPGQSLFGAISSEVQGSDLNPVLTSQTRLADLRGGLGISEGSIIVSDGLRSSTISISAAQTLGDVVRLLESNPPAGRVVQASVTARGLRIEMDAAGGGSLLVLNTKGSTTATELGIVRAFGAAADPIEGQDLDPILRQTTPLADILGVRARAVIESPGQNNDIVIDALETGPEPNGFTVQMVDDNLLQAGPGITAGNEFVEYSATGRAARAALHLSGTDNNMMITANSVGAQWNNVQIVFDASSDIGDAANVTFDAMAKTLTIQIDDSDETTAGSLATAINGSGLFTASPDSSMGDGYDPTASVLSADAGVRGNTGNSGGDAKTIFVHMDVNDSSAEDVIAALNASSDVNSRFAVYLDPKDTTAVRLERPLAVDVNASAVTEGGSGVAWDRDSGLQILNGDTTFTIDISQAETVDDLLSLLNNSEAMLFAEINEQQNGINVRSRLSGADFSIGENGGTTATALGIRSFARDTALTTLNHGRGVHSEPGTDFTIRRNDGVELDIDVSSAKTIGDVIDLINSHPDNLDLATRVLARLVETGNGIELVDDDPSGTNTLTVTRVSGDAAWELGLIPQGEPVAAASSTAATVGIQFAVPNDVNTALQIVAEAAGTQWNDVEVVFQDTLAGDVATASFDAIAGRLTIDMANGQTTTNTVIAALALEGTFRGELDQTSDATNDGSGTIVAPAGVAGTTAGGTAESIRGRDTAPRQTRGVFDTILRLGDAILNSDFGEIERLVNLMDEDFDQLNFGRAVVGARSQGLDATQIRNEDEQLEMTTILSEEIEVDLAVAASDFASRQAGYEASLRAIASLFQASLLDFL